MLSGLLRRSAGVADTALVAQLKWPSQLSFSLGPGRSVPRSEFSHQPSFFSRLYSSNFSKNRSMSFFCR
jgi:hypothetical protein